MEKIKRTVRMGIDVGGTYTKAVAIDNVSHEIIGKASVKTTHDSKAGVAEGIIQAFNSCLRENRISPDEVVFVAHSTTEATNALIEGDVACVGILGMGTRGLESLMAKIQTALRDINLGNGRKIKIVHEYLSEKNINRTNVIKAIKALKEKGAEVIVASKAYGVDDIADEEFVYNIAEGELGISTTMASDITKLYGLSRRTRTATINASILPKMLNTANLTEGSVKEAGVTVPLMIMRGDGGVMEINEMKKRPVLTMLSGPAASIMGSLIYLRASNGLYFEVGGTTTNIGVIKNGHPAIDYSMVGGNKTFISSLDVRVEGCAGGSMIRLSKDKVMDVGPRSAHIAGLDYAAFTPLDEIEEPRLELFSPRPGDPNDYVAIRLKSGKRVAITTTCAANLLGLCERGDFSYGSPESVRKCMEPVASYLHSTVDDVARAIMERAYARIAPIIEDLKDKYRLKHEDISLVGVGGGATALIRYIAKRMDLRYFIPRNAEVISSIGVALAMVRAVVERTTASPAPEDIRKIKREAIQRAIESGAKADTVEVHIEIEPEVAKLRAIAIGSTEAKATTGLRECTAEELLKIAIMDLHSNLDDVELIGSTNSFTAFRKKEKGSFDTIRVLDKWGFIRIQRASAACIITKASSFRMNVAKLWEDLATYTSDAILRPDYYLCFGSRIMDFNSSAGIDNILMLMELELGNVDSNEEIVIVAARNEI